MANSKQPYKIFILAGERSGDLHGANLIRSIKSISPDTEIRCWGGEQMEEAGAVLSVHYNNLAFMGFWEVFKNLITISKLLDQCKAEILSFQPDAVILIDYPGFNLKIAKFTHHHKLNTYYYIAPKAWAWNESRVHQLRKYIHKVYAILPFEVPFFTKFGINVAYVGNPLMDAIARFSPDEEFIGKFKSNKTIAVLPGSRAQEVQHMAGQLTGLIDKFPDFQFLVAAVDNLDPSLYASIKDRPNVVLVYNKTYDILKAAHAALVTSGTATLETALFNVPQIVCYHTSAITYTIAKSLIKIRFISLVNLIADEGVVPELIQDQFSVEQLTSELLSLVMEGEKRQAQLAGYKKIRSLVGDRRASDVTAIDILSDLRRS